MGDENAAFTNRSFISLTEFEREYHGESGCFLRKNGHIASKPFAPPERSGMHPFCVVNTPGGNPPAAIRHKRNQVLFGGAT